MFLRDKLMPSVILFGSFMKFLPKMVGFSRCLSHFGNALFKFEVEELVRGFSQSESRFFFRSGF